MVAPGTPPPTEDQVYGQLTLEPEIVVRIAGRLRADVWETEAVLKRMAAAGQVTRYGAGPGVPVRWSRLRAPN